MAGLNHQVPGGLDRRIGCELPRAQLPLEHSNQDENADLNQESDGHDRDGKEHVARRERVHECLA